MTENDYRDQVLEESDRLLARTFDAWRAILLAIAVLAAVIVFLVFSTNKWP